MLEYFVINCIINSIIENPFPKKTFVVLVRRQLFQLDSVIKKKIEWKLGCRSNWKCEIEDVPLVTLKMSVLFITVNLQTNL